MEAAAAADPLDELIDRALAEDHADDDRTTSALVPPSVHASAVLVAKADGVVAGIDVATRVFTRVAGLRGAPAPSVTWQARDGGAVTAGTRIADLSGRLDALLVAERTALNLLQRASGVATLTRAYVEAVRGTGARVLATRKTMPGLRALDLAAVRAGGGAVHRESLASGILVKENHLAAARAAGTAEDMAGLLRTLTATDRGVPIGVEVADEDELRVALVAGVDVVLLDNFSPERCAAAVALRRELCVDGSAPELEASGGIDLHTIRAFAEAGVERISVGALTHSAVALDLSLRFEGASGPDPEEARS